MNFRLSSARLLIKWFLTKNVHFRVPNNWGDWNNRGGWKIFAKLIKVGLKKGGRELDRQIVGVDISSKHVYSYAVRFLNCSLFFSTQFLYFVHCSELISDSLNLIKGVGKIFEKSIIGRGRFFCTLELS